MGKSKDKRKVADSTSELSDSGSVKDENQQLLDHGQYGKCVFISIVDDHKVDHLRETCKEQLF